MIKTLAGILLNWLVAFVSDETIVQVLRNLPGGRFVSVLKSTPSGYLVEACLELALFRAQGEEMVTLSVDGEPMVLLVPMDGAHAKPSLVPKIATVLASKQEME